MHWSSANLWEERIPNSLPVVLSKRMMLPHINGLYYPLGLPIPFTLQTKLLLRRLWTEKERKLGWNDNITSHLKPEWFIFFQKLFFSDRSQEVFGRCIYARWRLSNGKYESHLIAAKWRTAPVKKISVVRLELNGVLMRTQLSNFIKEESRPKFEKKYFMCSRIVKVMLQK